MGFWSSFLGFDTFDAAQRVLADPYEPFNGYAFSSSGIPVADPGVPLVALQRTEAEQFWRSQPNLRKVVDFIARNVASVPLHVHERVSDTNRQRVTDGPLADLMSTPRPRVGSFRFWHSVISDGLLYDRWALVVRTDDNGNRSLVQVPSWRLRFDTNLFREVTAAWFWVGDEDAPKSSDKDGWRPLDLDSLIFDHGYAPRTAGLSPVATLRDVLQESAEAVRYRRQVWENGARVPMSMTRPVDAPKWETEQRDRFANHFRQTFTGVGENAGGVPVLEDGMELHEHRSFSPQDAQDLEGRRLTAIEVAAAFHIAPELVGAQQGNYSNVREYRQMLYRDSLGPYIVAIEEAINTQLTPSLSEGRKLYVEANVEAKLRGSFEERAAVMSTAIGAPWMSRNEGRALDNRPPIEGGDELVTPLNVLLGGQASPQDSGSQNRRSGPVRRKARPENHEAKHERVMKAFFARQRQEVKSHLGSKDDEDWWDPERWDKELTDTLVRLYLLTSRSAAQMVLEDSGLDDYDVDRTMAFLDEAAKRSAKSINAATHSQISDALTSDDPSAGVDGVFDVAEGSRSTEIAASGVTFASAFGSLEAARQNSDRATKTWVVTSGNPRPSHAALNGETVPVSENFSNGMAWPGDASGGADEVAGCSCEMDVNIR